MREQIKRYLKYWAGIEELVRLGIEEFSDIDFKKEPYAHPKKTPEKKREDQLELRRDVTSFANAKGGVIVIGIAENELGQAASLEGIVNVRDSESFLSEILSRDIAPAFQDGDLLVRVLRDHKNSSLAVILIEVQQSKPGRPRAVINHGLSEFWIREGKSKRPMTYDQIEQDFHGDQSAEEQRRIDAQAKHLVLQIQIRLEKASSKWAIVRDLLEQLKEYSDELRYGFSVKEAVLDAASIPLDYARSRITYDVANRALDLIDKVLPINSLVGPSRPLSEREVALLQGAASTAVDLIYDATRRLDDIILINAGAQLLHKILLFAGLNDMQEFKSELLAEFDERISWAEADGVKDGDRLLKYYKEEALVRMERNFLEYPPGLEWLIWHSPEEMPKDYVRTKE